MIPIDKYELATYYMTKKCKNFMERVEARIVNSKQPLFGVTYPNRVYYSSFGDTDNADDNVLSYGEDIQDQKGVEVN